MGGRAKAAVAEARELTAVSFAEAMEMVKDKEKAEAFFGRLEALKREINAEIDKSLTIEEIDRLLIQTRDDRNMAAEELEGARADAKKILADSGAAARQASEDRDRRSRDRERAVGLREKTVSDREARFKAAAEQAEAAMAEREGLIATREDKATADLAEAKETKARSEGLIADIQKRAAAA